MQIDDFKGRVLETKRGIKIGSSAREVAEVYKGLVSQFEAGGEKFTLEEYEERRVLRIGQRIIGNDGERD